MDEGEGEGDKGGGDEEEGGVMVGGRRGIEKGRGEGGAQFDFSWGS